MKNTEIKDYYYNKNTKYRGLYTYRSNYCQYKILHNEYWSGMINLTTYKLIRHEAHRTIRTNY